MNEPVGISGFAVYVPPYRIDLEAWCAWTGNPWDKTKAVVGRSFRMRGPAQSVYTIAATAVLRLIERYDVDPSRVGFLGLGTESSTDNSAGAVIIKGMLDDALTDHTVRCKPLLALEGDHRLGKLIVEDVLSARTGSAHIEALTQKGDMRVLHP